MRFVDPFVCGRHAGATLTVESIEKRGTSFRLGVPTRATGAITGDVGSPSGTVWVEPLHGPGDQIRLRISRCGTRASGEM